MGKKISWPELVTSANIEHDLEDVCKIAGPYLRGYRCDDAALPSGFMHELPTYLRRRIRAHVYRGGTEN